MFTTIATQEALDDYIENGDTFLLHVGGKEYEDVLRKYFKLEGFVNINENGGWNTSPELRSDIKVSS